jgi:chemotaxis-related protein WspB
VLVDYETADEEHHLLGLMLERVSGIERIDPGEFTPSGIDTPQAAYLGQVSARDGGIVQLVDVDRLLTDEVRALLFQADLYSGQVQ